MWLKTTSRKAGILLPTRIWSSSTKEYWHQIKSQNKDFTMSSASLGREGRQRTTAAAFSKKSYFIEVIHDRFLTYQVKEKATNQ
jgi:hypothetical protein